MISKQIFFKAIYTIISSSVLNVHVRGCDQVLKSVINQHSMLAVRELAINPKCDVHAKLATWLALKENYKLVQFSDYQHFIDHNPSWPRRQIFIDKAEALTHQIPDAIILKWFDKHPPKTGAGALRYLRAYHINPQQPISAQHISRIRHFWIHTDFNTNEKHEFLQIYGDFLTPRDHYLKIITLLNKGDTSSVLRLCDMISDNDRAYINARVAFITHQNNAEALMTLIDQSRSHDSYLLFDYLHWLRKRKHPSSAKFLLKMRPHMLQQTEKLWKETHILIRRALEDNDYSLALQLVTGHNLKPGVDYCEAEWLRGWLTLKLLNDALTAKKIFQHLHSTVTSPISLAKTAYWTAVASQICEPKVAHYWFQKAANYPTAFYGQISAKYLRHTAKLRYMPLPSTLLQQQFRAHELVKVIRILKTLHMDNYCRDFLNELIDNISPEKKILVVQLAKQVDPEHMVSLARKVPVTGNIIIKDAYPFLPAKIFKKTAHVDVALLHALIRRESNFDHKAISQAGAVGLMQVMPDTGRRLIKSMNIKTGNILSLSDPEFNVLLGSTYLSRLLQNYQGSIVMALCEYNAGPEATSNWVRYFGDPRHKDVDMIDWMEMIPYGETRNYVQRVIEGQGVYQMIIDSQKKLHINKNVNFKTLHRGKKLAKAKA